MEGYQQGGGNGGKGTGNKKHKWKVQNRQREVKNSIGNPNKLVQGPDTENIYLE